MAGGPRYSHGDAEEHTFLTAEDRKKRFEENLTSLDQKLVQMAGAYSPAEIAEKTGIPAEEVAKRTIDVLNSIDYFTIEQMQARSMIMLNRLISEAMNRLESVSDRNLGALLNSTGGNLQRNLKELQGLQAQAEKNSSQMEKAYAKRLLTIVDRAFDRYLGKLSERYPDEDPRDIAEGFQRTILEIAREIDAEE